jgi:flagellar protein FlaI
VFRWNSVTDTFEFTGYMNSYLLEEVISLKIGLPPTRKREIYDEMARRAEILSKFNEQGVTDFQNVYQTLAKAYREGIF